MHTGPYTTIDTLSDDTIRALAYEAGCAGDVEAKRICERALTGDQKARQWVADWVADTEAQDCD